MPSSGSGKSAGAEHVVERISQDIFPSGVLKLLLKFFLMIALLALRCPHLDPNVLPVDHANNVGTPQSAEPIEVFI